MTPAELAKVRAVEALGVTVAATDLDDQSNRVLLRGRHTTGETVEVLLDDGQLTIVTAGGTIDSRMETQEAFPIAALTPNKRAFPEDTDFDFARLLIERGAHLAFTPHPDA